LSVIQGWDMQVPPDPIEALCPACPIGRIGTRNQHYNPHFTAPPQGSRYAPPGTWNLDGMCWLSRRPVLDPDAYCPLSAKPQVPPPGSMDA